MLNIFLQSEAEKIENLIVPDSVQKARFAETVRYLADGEFLSNIWRQMADWLVWTGIKFIISLAIYYVCRFVLRKVLALVDAIMTRRGVEISLHSFILTAVKVRGYVFIVLIIVSILGFNSSSFLAVLASMGLAIGMALSGTLQNFAGGVLILLLKPYKIGDYIEAQGYAGTVREIQIFHTIITTYDNKSIIIPNGGLSTSSINNWSTQDYRRVEWEIAISYGDSVDAARKAILDMFATDPRILRKVDEEKNVLDEYNKALAEEENPPTLEPRKHGLLYRIFHRKSKVKEAIERWQEKQDNHLKALKPCVTSDASVVVNKLADSSLLIEARAWVKNSDYWSVYYHYNERFYNELPNYGINFPFPQMDLHIKQ